MKRDVTQLKEVHGKLVYEMPVVWFQSLLQLAEETEKASKNILPNRYETKSDFEIGNFSMKLSALLGYIRSVKDLKDNI